MAAVGSHFVTARHNALGLRRPQCDPARRPVPRRACTRSYVMLSWFIRRRIKAFEASFDYDASYAHEMLELNRAGLIALNRATALGAVRAGVPTDVFFAAKLAATLHEDCGPCVQIVATMAERAGVAPKVIS